MSNYGPPGGSYPGPPQEPWPGREPHDPYGQPPQQWGGQHPWNAPSPHPQYGSPQSAHPPYGQPGHGDDRGGYEPTRAYEPDAPVGPEPAWSEPAPVPPVPDGRGSRTPVLVLVVALALLVCGGGGTALYLLGRGEEHTTAQASPQPSDAATSGASSPTAAPRASTPGAQSSADARFVKVGQCVKNDGAATQPRLVITKCATKTYQVLARIDGATTGERDAKAKCGKVKGYTDWYFFNSELDVLDFVLCLKLR
ncbi:MAG TPA: flagellar basal body protein FliL [Micromonosporaceae bacterium]|nr:flagellar basal body protein FliL [Micromonosporaceae bacterium]